ncbi:hypothetical protein [Acinetobacter sp. BWR-L5]|uniref:hypothetical protein n=1 Tax=Acinetobacter sp. BWR-L5 TaxID=2815725 RepID=UPI0031FEF252
MAYYNGQASSYQELLNALVGACTQPDNAWIWSNGVLHKSDLFIGFSISTNGIICQGGTGLVNGILQGTTGVTPRLGRFSTSLFPLFPCNYHIFIFEDEVYLIAKFDSDFYYLAFGKSTLISNGGLWVSASTGADVGTNTGLSISTSSGAGYWATACAPFWGTYNNGGNCLNSIILHNLDGGKWSNYSITASVLYSILPLHRLMPSTFFSDAILLPYSVTLVRPQDKRSIVCEFQNARFTRVDNFESEQIINLGSERWMIFPFYRKNIDVRDGGSNINHSGTLGWAIRYDGP